MNDRIVFLTLGVLIGMLLRTSPKPKQLWRVDRIGAIHGRWTGSDGSVEEFEL